MDRSPIPVQRSARHEQFIANLRGTPNGAAILRRVGYAGSVTSIDLTDATDDFDFVVDDTASRGDIIDRLAFRMIDDNQGDDPIRDARTDRWVSNQREVFLDKSGGLFGIDGSNRLDPWNPDSDGDGLTDGT